MGFVGQNGAGKTTTIRLILNMIARDSGSLKIFGMDNILNEQKIKQDIAVVLDDIFFVENWNVHDVEKAIKVFMTIGTAHYIISIWIISSYPSIKR